MSETKITYGYLPGAIGRVTELHGIYYSQYWDLGLFFEAKAAMELSEFLSRFDPAHDGFWIATHQNKMVGSVTIDGHKAHSEGARLRWFILDDAFQGLGIGKQLLTAALDFCRQKNFKRVYLTTFAGLDAARHLYEKVGFNLYEEQEDAHWGKTLREQKFELWLR